MIARSHPISYTNAVQRLTLIGQEHLLHFWHELSPDQQRHLLQQIKDLDSAQFIAQQNLLGCHSTIDKIIAPFDDFSVSGSQEDAALGRELIAQGKVGCIIIAGGQGTRLRFNGVKGIFPVTPVKHKSLFQLFAEKTIAAGKQAGRPLPLAIMTSPQNHSETVAFFDKHHRFGMEAKQLNFFSQGQLPLLDEAGNMFLNAHESIAFGPDGNGSCLAHFVKSGLWQSWKNAGIQYLSLILIDNALADPFPAEFIGFHARKGAQITVKCIERLAPEEKLGLLVTTSQGIGVIEYSEMPESERVARSPDGMLKHRCANMSTFCFDMDFVRGSSLLELPLHLAHKAVPYIDENGNEVEPQSPNAWKFERFIFDLLPCAQSVSALLCPRDHCFAPLKNETGDSSLQTVQSALLHRDKAILESITGHKVTVNNIELAQEFYYLTPELIARWRHHPVPDEGYIVDF